MFRMGRMIRSAKLTPPHQEKLIPPVHSTTARGTFPIEHTKLITATSRPTSGPQTPAAVGVSGGEKGAPKTAGTPPPDPPPPHTPPPPHGENPPPEPPGEPAGPKPGPRPPAATAPPPQQTPPHKKQAAPPPPPPPKRNAPPPPPRPPNRELMTRLN